MKFSPSLIHLLLQLRSIPSRHRHLHAVVFPFPSHPKIPPGVEKVKNLENSGNAPIISALSNLRDPIIHWFQSHSSPPVAIVSDFVLGCTVQIARRLNIPRISFYSSGAFFTAVNNLLWLNMEVVRGRKVVEFSEIPGTPSFKEEHINYRESDPDWVFVKQSAMDNFASWGRWEEESKRRRKRFGFFVGRILGGEEKEVEEEDEVERVKIS